MLLILAMNSLCNAQSPLGGAPGAYLRLGTDIHTMMLANASISNSNQPTSGFSNPAIPAIQRTHSITLSTAQYGLDRSMNTLYATHPIGPDGGMSYGLAYYSNANLVGRNSEGIETGRFDVTEAMGHVGFGLRLKHSSIIIGVALKWLYADFYDKISTTSTWGIDIGIAKEWEDFPLTIGFVIQNINAAYKWDTQALYQQSGNSTIDYFPLRYRLGLTTVLSDYHLIINSEIEYWTYNLDKRGYEVVENGPFSYLQSTSGRDTQVKGMMGRFSIKWQPVDLIAFFTGIDRYDFSYQNISPIIPIGFETQFDLMGYSSFVAISYNILFDSVPSYGGLSFGTYF